ncbi:glycoside hydrolase family 2 TIM barrel-domain containing protein, partial [Planctomycetota bacterium]
MVCSVLAFGLLMPALGSAQAVQESFNKDWMFFKDDCIGAEQRAHDESDWRTLDLPHDWAIEGPFDVKYNARCGGLPFHGTGWYRKHFKLAPKYAGKRVWVEFDGAMNNADVWVNGHHIGEHPYGYTGFRLELTPHIEFGSRENVIAVRLCPEDLSSRWYPGAGIYRNVRLMAHEDVHFGYLETIVTTARVNENQAIVRIKTVIENDGPNALREIPITLTTRILDPEMQQVASAEQQLQTDASCSVEQTLNVKSPLLWDVDHPSLYSAIMTLKRGDQVLNGQEISFGIREIEFSSKKGFLLNGRHTKLNGVCLHHDLGPLGAAINRRAIERKLQILKQMGCNAIRTSHNSPSPELVELCDQMGIMLQAEAFDCWVKPKVKNDYGRHFEAWHERDLRFMLKRFRNSPSVIMWSIGNEVPEQRQPVGAEWARRLTDICHDEDPTRPVTACFCLYEPAIENGLAQAVDLVGLNYKPDRYEELIKEHPEWIVYGSETCSTTSSRGVYHLPVTKYRKHASLQLTSYDIIGPPWAYPPDKEFYWQDKLPNILGEFVWTGFDYLGEPTPFGGRDNTTDGYWNSDWPSRSSYFGIVDLCGFPKDRFYLYQSKWTKTPMVHIYPHWNWEGREGSIIPVIAYSNCDEVELLLSGKSLGRKRVGANPVELPVDFAGTKRKVPRAPLKSHYRIQWDVPYQPGTLLATGFVNGKAVCRKQITTAGSPAKIELVADRSTVIADGQDLLFVTARILDSNDNVCPMASNKVDFAA